MAQTLYASFADITLAEKAAGALIDFGAHPDDLSLVASGERRRQVKAQGDELPPEDPIETTRVIDNAAKNGITTTTAYDAELGAVKGAGLGLVLGAIAAFAVPGIGWALGGGALAAALSATALATGAGAIAGGVFGYLKDQGVPHEAAEGYRNTIHAGGALLTLHLDDSRLDQATAEEIIMKYHGTEVTAY